MERVLLFTEYRDKILSLNYGENRLKKIGVYNDKQVELEAIYVGKVKNVVPTIDACFVEFKPDIIGFLPMKQCKNAILLNRENNGKLVAGDEIIVQIEKEEMKTKAPGLTCNLSFKGKYSVITTGQKNVGFSSKLKAGNKLRLKEWLFESNLIQQLKQEEVGLIVRTNAADLVNKDIFLQEVNELIELKNKIISHGIHRTCFSCIYRPSSPWITEIRDLYQSDFDKIITDIPDVYKEIIQTFTDSFPIELYQDKKISLGRLYSVETRIKEALDERVWLKSGAYLIIQPTEALTVIDVNSGKIQKKHPGDDIYFSINKEAAGEIAFQLKLRNISGIIVVDFINQNNEAQDKELLKFFSHLVKEDPVKTNVIDMTSLGLVEVTRKKIHKPLRELL